VACSLDLFGNRWALLVVGDLLQSRFKEFVASPQGIPANILSERLDRFLRNKTRRSGPGGPKLKHLAYRLKAKGEAPPPSLLA
jgi:DNA-binding HxlR family transcriptional regulator